MRFAPDDEAPQRRRERGSRFPNGNALRYNVRIQQRKE